MAKPIDWTEAIEAVSALPPKVLMGTCGECGVKQPLRVWPLPPTQGNEAQFEEGSECDHRFVRITREVTPGHRAVLDFLAQGRATWDGVVANHAAVFGISHPPGVAQIVHDLQEWGFVACSSKGNVVDELWLTDLGRRAAEL